MPFPPWNKATLCLKSIAPGEKKLVSFLPALVCL